MQLCVTVSISDCILDGPDPEITRFRGAVADSARLNSDPTPPPKNLAMGRIACVLLNSNFAGPVLGNLDPIFCKIGHVGERLRSPNVEFPRRHLSAEPFCEWEA